MSLAETHDHLKGSDLYWNWQVIFWLNMYLKNALTFLAVCSPPINSNTVVVYPQYSRSKLLTVSVIISASLSLWMLGWMAKSELKSTYYNISQSYGALYNENLIIVTRIHNPYFINNEVLKEKKWNIKSEHKWNIKSYKK
jgi:hypothetical protein